MDDRKRPATFRIHVNWLITAFLLATWLVLMGAWVFSLDRSISWKFPDEGLGGNFMKPLEDGRPILRGRTGSISRSISLLQGALIYMATKNYCERFPLEGFPLRSGHQFSNRKMTHHNWQEACGFIMPRFSWDQQSMASTTQVSATFIKIPIWLLVVPCTILVCWRVTQITKRPARPYECLKCRYNLIGTKSQVCSECGTTIPPEQTERIKSASKAPIA